MTAGTLRLFSYWRSSAAYRVRIALTLKGLPHEIVPVHLIHDGGQQRTESYRRLNPQRLVPVLVDGHRVIRQSMAIIEYLDETWPDPPLLPPTARDRARVRAIAQAIACDVHPLNNLRVLQFLEHEWNIPQAERERWVRHWIAEGFAAVEELLANHASTGSFCEGDTPSLADLCLIPQVYNAIRFGVDLSRYPTIQRINAECLQLPAFQAAQPENQPDAPAAG